MPVKQQYIVASAIIALVAVVAVLGVFDYRADRARVAQLTAIQQQGIPCIPPRVTEFNDGRFVGQGMGMGNGAGIGMGPGAGQGMGQGLGMGMGGQGRGLGRGMGPVVGATAAAAVGTQCVVCGWQGRCMPTGLCPNCTTQQGVGPNARAGEPVETRKASFLWFGSQQQAPVATRPVLSCPQCNFSMNPSAPVSTNTILCPKCGGYLMSSEQPVSGTAAAGQPVTCWNPNGPMR